MKREDLAQIQSLVVSRISDSEEHFYKELESDMEDEGFREEEKKRRWGQILSVTRYLIEYFRKANLESEVLSQKESSWQPFVDEILDNYDMLDKEKNRE